MHYKVQTEIGNKVCDVTELETFIELQIVTKIEYIASDEDLNETSAEDIEKINKINIDYKLVKKEPLKVLPEKFRTRKPNPKFKIKGVQIGYHELNDTAIQQMGLVCRFCGNKQNHHYCSPNGSCVYLDRIKSMNTRVPDMVTDKYKLFPKSMGGCRHKSTPIIPYHISTTRDKKHKFWAEAYFFIDVNGTIINPYLGERATIAAVSNAMMCPWNNPLLDNASRYLWSKLFEIKKEAFRLRLTHELATDAQLFMKAVKKFYKPFVKKHHGLYRFMNTRLNPVQEESLREFCKNSYIAEPFDKRKTDAQWFETIGYLPAKIYG